MKIQIESIPHEKQRYETVGDWFYDVKGELCIKVSQMSDERYMLLVALHELIEVILCKHRGITQEQVDAFDMKFEDNREAEMIMEKTGSAEERALKIAEPGDDKNAPYRKEHCFATGIERLMAAELDIIWAQYEKEVQLL